MASQIGLFNVVCKNCQDNKRESHTHIHVDWNKKNWIYVCLTPGCGSLEAFDETGAPITLEKKEEKEEVKKQSN